MIDMDIEKEIVAKGKTAARLTPELDCQNLALEGCLLKQQLHEVKSDESRYLRTR
ncbi:hypothetical protein NLN85_22235 [Citrobacter portucalensis]|uniref:hypothetical protein n=1 Tax=Citrobacter portucalensis TaxID=1639133 RepID=UPI00226B7902|nr:hypothetical protein [Citrobacter portucalensis]MCX8995197.1 hypothetical protein [Citrobacter portucalensis]